MGDTYKVYPFVITKWEDYAIIQNCNNITILKDQEMIRFFESMDAESSLVISEGELNHHFPQSTDSAMSFMICNKLMCKVKVANRYFENLLFLTNDLICYNSFIYNSEGCEISSDAVYIEDFATLPEEYWHEHRNDLIIFMLNPFSLKMLEKVVNIVREYNITTRVVFSYNNNVYFSNYYKPEWYNPCPKCFFAHLEGALRCASHLQDAPSYQTIIDLIYTRSPAFPIYNRFTPHIVVPIISELLKDVPINDNYNVNGVKIYDISKRKINYDNIIHWELCDCYE